MLAENLLLLLFVWLKILHGEPLVKTVKRYTVFNLIFTYSRTTQLGEICSRPESLADVTCQRAYVCSFSAYHAYLRLLSSVIKTKKFYLLYVHRLGF